MESDGRKAEAPDSSPRREPDGEWNRPYGCVGPNPRPICVRKESSKCDARRPTRLLATGGVVVAAILQVAGRLLVWAHDPAVKPYIEQYAGDQVTNGGQAKVYADHHIILSSLGLWHLRRAPADEEVLPSLAKPRVTIPE